MALRRDPPCPLLETFDEVFGTLDVAPHGSSEGPIDGDDHVGSRQKTLNCKDSLPYQSAHTGAGGCGFNVFELRDDIGDLFQTVTIFYEVTLRNSFVGADDRQSYKNLYSSLHNPLDGTGVWIFYPGAVPVSSGT